MSQNVNLPRRALSALNPTRIAVLRALQLGDVLCAVPALRALRAAFPRSRITFIGLPWARAFVERFSSYLDDWIEFPGYPGLPERAPCLRDIPDFFLQAQQRHFDLAIQLHGNGSSMNAVTALLGARRSAGFYQPGAYCPDNTLFTPYPNRGSEIDRLMQLMAFLGIASRGSELEFPLHQKDVETFEALSELADLRPGSFVCLHPGARWISRRWTPEGFAAVGDALAALGFRVVLTGSHEEALLIEQVSRLMSAPVTNAAGLTTLGSLAVLLSRSRLLVCNDTGVSHVAAALKVPSVVLCMGSDPERWAPLDPERHRFLSVPMDCRPCAYRICPIGHGCATQLQPSMVIAAARQALEKEITLV